MEGMIFIKQNFKPYVENNQGRFGENEDGFYTVNPMSGFLENEKWEYIDKFQKGEIENRRENIHEFNVIHSVDRNGIKKYYRSYVEFNKLIWELV
jgi:hypothetical protein